MVAHQMRGRQCERVLRAGRDLHDSHTGERGNCARHVDIVARGAAAVPELTLDNAKFQEFQKRGHTQ